MSRSQQIIILFFCLLSLCLVVLAQTSCDPLNRPKPEDCANQPNQTTCAYYTANCPIGTCGRLVLNECYACTNPDVTSYEAKPCDEDILIFYCTQPICDPNLPYWKVFNFYPACGTEDSDDLSDQDTFQSACGLCQESDYQYFRLLPCKKDRVYCHESDASDDVTLFDADESDESDFVCAFFTTPDVGQVFTTVPTGREACDDPAVDYFTRGGPCGPFYGNATYCLPTNRPEGCTTEYAPVCGSYKDVNGTTLQRTADNACSACAATDILYHTPGACPVS